MEKINYIYIQFFFLIFFINIFQISFSFPFENIYSTQLRNGNFILIHKKGIDICDNYLNKIIRTEIVFSNEEQITTDIMKNVKIKEFEDGYLICLINNKIYIFNNLGEFLFKKENINLDKEVNYYSIDTKDNYHFFIGIISESCLNLYYYEYNISTNTTELIAQSGDITKSEPKWFGLGSTDYTFQNSGLAIHTINNINRGEALACFFIICMSGKCYWQMEFFKVSDDSLSFNLSI